VYRYDKFVTKVLDFSKDAERIETAIKNIRDIQPDQILDTNLPRGPFSIPGPVINGAAVVPPGQVGVIVTMPRNKSTVLHDAIFAASSDLGTRERNRRKMVLVISDGASSGNTHDFDETTQNLLERNVQVYAVGLDQPFPYKKLSILDDYAKQTGGDVYFTDSVRHIEQAYTAATEEARNQYVLGYVSNNELLGPGPVFRDIAVEVFGRNLKALHRKGYYQYP
jgi:VWFA-related protein